MWNLGSSLLWTKLMSFDTILQKIPGWAPKALPGLMLTAFSKIMTSIFHLPPLKLLNIFFSNFISDFPFTFEKDVVNFVSGCLNWMEGNIGPRYFKNLILRGSFLLRVDCKICSTDRTVRSTNFKFRIWRFELNWKGHRT